MKNVFYFILPLSAFFLVSCGHEKESPAPENTNPGVVTLTPIQLQNITLDTATSIPEEESLTLTGKISFDQSKVEKVYPLVGGNVISVNVSLGDKVKKGQLLGTIRSTEISDLQSQYVIAQNNLNVASKNRDIAEELYKSHTYSEVQVIAARHDYASAEAEMNRLNQSLAVYGASANSSDGLYNVYSPIDGYVVEKNINEGMEIRTDFGTQIFTVSALNTVWVLADVYESDFAKVHEGESASIRTVAYPDSVFYGTISHVDNVLDPDSKVAHARVELDNSKGLLRPEMFAEVTVHRQLPTKMITVASSSVVFQDGESCVLVRKSPNTFERRKVEVGNTAGKSRVFITDGLREGEVVVSKGSVYVANVE